MPPDISDLDFARGGVETKMNASVVPETRVPVEEFVCAGAGPETASLPQLRVVLYSGAFVRHLAGSRRRGTIAPVGSGGVEFGQPIDRRPKMREQRNVILDIQAEKQVRKRLATAAP